LTTSTGTARLFEGEKMKIKPGDLPITEAPTMTSLEMVKFINEERKSKAEAKGLTFPCKGFAELKHKEFLRKVPRVLGETASAQFCADVNYPTFNGAESTRKIYKFPRREACLMAMSFSYELQAKVFDRMNELEGVVDVNQLDFARLKNLTVAEMQNRVVLAEQYSFEEHGQRGSGLMQIRKREKKQIEAVRKTVEELSQLKLPGFSDEGELVA